MKINVEEHLGLAYQLAMKMQRKYRQYEVDDLFQIACVELVKCGKTFDEKYGCKFITYAGKSMEMSIHRYATRDRRYVKKTGEFLGYTVASLNSKVYDKDGSESELQNTLQDKFDLENEFINNYDLQNALNKLTEREKKFITLYFFQSKSQTEIAKEIGISQVQVCRNIKNILNKLKKELNYKECC